MNPNFKASIWWIGCAENENSEIEQLMVYKSFPNRPTEDFFTGKIYGRGKHGMDNARADFIQRNCGGQE